MVALIHEEHNLFVNDLTAGLFIIYEKHSWMFSNITFCQEINMVYSEADAQHVILELSVHLG